MNVTHVASARTDIELGIHEALELIQQLTGAVQSLQQDHITATSFTSHGVYNDKRGADRKIAGVIFVKVLK